MTGPNRPIAAPLAGVLAAPIRGYGTPAKNIGVLLLTVDISPLGAAVRDTTGLGETGEVVLGVQEGKTARTLFPPRYRAGTGECRSVPCPKYV